MQISEERYFSIDILDSENDNIILNKTTLSNYIKSNFPLLNAFRDDRNNESDLIKRREISSMIAVILNRLNLPRYLIITEYGNFAYEPITKNVVYSNNLTDKKIIQEDLEYYFGYNYDERIQNFFNPSMHTIKEAQLTKEAFVEERIKLRTERGRNRRNIKMKLKGMKKNDK